MDFGPHSNFVPQSPLSYSTSYIPYTSPTPKDNEKNQKRQEDVGNCYNNALNEYYFSIFYNKEFFF
jgi:hypothetical protein